MRYLFLLLFAPIFCCAQTIELEKLTITKSAQSRSQEIFSDAALRTLAVTSSEEVPGYSSSVSLTRRANFGVQQDASIRGSVFEDAAITIFGVKIKDPQTGHFSLEVPFTSADIDEVGISANTQEIDYRLKQPQDKGSILATGFGAHALWTNLISSNFAFANIKNRVSAEHKIAKGARHDTDFEIYNFSYDALFARDGNEAEFVFGTTRRDFGADSFYSNRFTQEEEHIDQRFFSLRTRADMDLFTLEDTLYLRRHRDKFILDRTNPSFYTNYHTNYIYGLTHEFDFRNNAVLGLELERETIDSTNLAKHYRLRKGFFTGIKEKELGRFVFDCIAGLDYYDSWKYLDHQHLALGYRVFRPLIARFSFDRIWRAPSFTELFYSDPANRGNPGLSIQRSNNYEWSLQYQASGSVSLKGGYFLRTQANTIDWVKDDLNAPWDAGNIGKLDARGFDLLSQVDLNKGIFKTFSLGYTYLVLDKDAPTAFSKYVFDYNTHKLTGTGGLELLGTRVDLAAHFVDPVQRNAYVTADIKIAKTFDRLTLSLEGTNIFNTGFQEALDIPGAGRWYMLNVSYSF